MEVDPEAAQLEFLLQQYEEEKRFRQVYEEESIEVQPTPEFVVKTQVQCGDDDSHQKVFINICSSDEIAAPEETEDGRYRIPVSCGPMRSSHDKAGCPAISYDCILSPIPIQQCLQDREYRALIVQYCIENIETKNAVRLSKNIRFPKAKYLGGYPVRQRIRRQQRQNQGTIRDKISDCGANAEFGNSISGEYSISGKPLIEEISPVDEKEQIYPNSKIRTLIKGTSSAHESEQACSALGSKRLTEEVSTTDGIFETDAEMIFDLRSCRDNEPEFISENKDLAVSPSSHNKILPKHSGPELKVLEEPSSNGENQVQFQLKWIRKRIDFRTNNVLRYMVLEITGVQDPNSAVLEVSDWGVHISGVIDVNIPLQRSWIPIKATYYSKTSKLHVMLKIGFSESAGSTGIVQKPNAVDRIRQISNNLQFQLI